MQQVPTNDEELMSIVNFENICVAISLKRIQLSHLPLTWDLSLSKWLVDGHLQLRVQTVKYEQGHEPVRGALWSNNIQSFELVCCCTQLNGGAPCVSKALVHHARNCQGLC
jgi:hypothetical protein